MSKSAYAMLAQDCESSDSVVRYAKIKSARKPNMKIKLRGGRTMLVSFRKSVDTVLDEYCLERDESLLHEDRPETLMESQGMHIFQVV